ncbi:DUF4446 family protein [Paenibacillus radicis (ex Xue et al. 2023)]|uniref:DUF4446 family protein n=1 Tax=Paenibacillus radicis (ex Xue et al. 2023) TaxID=2972489 RepID=A0ABT1YUZ2_9BACL|nr:DUF4446 family protein [Paenibacillus radicis (ex Xue et al. 2023)]MCR8636766.1 DUF4446 family protein [Paenibacillus radicis (ex Xue et al. 2023)]
MGEILELLDVRVLMVVMIIVIVVFLIIVLVLSSKLNKLRKNYMSMLNGDASLNVESALIGLQEKVASSNAEVDGVKQQIQLITQQMKTMKSKIGIYRYNAFAESGSDLSFSLAILDENVDGVVVSGIHNREETYVYAKPLTKGQSQYPLSPEEKEAINRCVSTK